MRVIVAGGANIDLLGRASRPVLPGDSTPGAVTFRCGGVGRNICENLARLGAETALVSAVGNDWAGALLLRTCAECGIDTSCVRCMDGRTGTYLAAEGFDGELLAAINDMDILHTLTPEALLNSDPFLRSADALVLDANLPEESLIWLTEHSGGIPVFADPVSCAKAERLLPVLPHLYFLKPNRAELRLLSGEEDVEAGIRVLLARGVKNICVSLGPGGARLVTRDGGDVFVPAPQAEIRSVTGAGDSLTAGLIFALLSRLEPRAALRFGVAAAGLTLQYEGAVRPDLSVSLIENAVKELLP